jgi:hypothetical protein
MGDVHDGLLLHGLPPSLSLGVGVLFGPLAAACLIESSARDIRKSYISILLIVGSDEPVKTADARATEILDSLFHHSYL